MGRLKFKFCLIWMELKRLNLGDCGGDLIAFTHHRLFRRSVLIINSQTKNSPFIAGFSIIVWKRQYLPLYCLVISAYSLSIFRFIDLGWLAAIYGIIRHFLYVIHFNVLRTAQLNVLFCTWALVWSSQTGHQKSPKVLQDRSTFPTRGLALGTVTMAILITVPAFLMRACLCAFAVGGPEWVWTGGSWGWVRLLRSKVDVEPYLTMTHEEKEDWGSCFS